MPTLRIPLVGSWTERKVDAAATDTADQQFINCFPEVTKNPVTGKPSAVLNKRAGFQQTDEVASGFLCQTAGGVIWIALTDNSRPAVMPFRSGTTMRFYSSSSAGSIVQVGGDIANITDALYTSDARFSGTAHLIATLLDGSSREFWYYPNGGSWTQITDGDFPADALTTHVSRDGYLFIMTLAGRIHQSAVNNPASWAVTDFFATSTPGVAVACYQDFIVGFNTHSVSLFYNAGNAAGSVLRRVNDGHSNVGALKTEINTGPTTMMVGDNVYWIGVESSGAMGIYRFKGIRPEKISNPGIDKLVNKGEIDYIHGAICLHGMNHVVFRSGAENRAYCYCIDTGAWWMLQHGLSATMRSVVGAVGSGKSGTSFMGLSGSARFFISSPDSLQWVDSSSTAYSMVAQTENIDANTDRKKVWKKLRLVYDKQSSASAIGVSWSDDDYGNFSSAVNIDTANAAGWISKLGASRRRAWKFTHSANTACRIHAVEIEYDLGIS